MHKTFMLQGGKIVECEEHAASIIVYYSPGDDEKKHLVETLQIDEHTLGSALDPEELGRMEFEPEHAAIIFKRPKQYTAADNFFFRVTTCGYFLFADKLVIIDSEHAVPFEGRLFSRVHTIQDLLLRLLFQNISHFVEHLKVMNSICNQLEDEIVKARENRHLMHMFTIAKGLVYYLHAINSNGRVLGKLKASAVKTHLNTENLEYLDDLLIDNAQCSEQANTHAQVLASLMDARAFLVSNNLNVMMKNLNAIVIAVSVPNFVAAVGGMSEFTMMTGVRHWAINYSLFFLAMVALGWVTFYAIVKWERFWRRRGF